MVTAPLFVVLLLITVVCVKGKVAKGGSVVLGVLLGLTLASTALGTPILDGLTAASNGIVSSITKASGNR